MQTRLTLQNYGLLKTEPSLLHNGGAQSCTVLAIALLMLYILFFVLTFKNEAFCCFISGDGISIMCVLSFVL